jgi:hypothetical protein
MSTMDGLTQFGSTSHCGPSIPKIPKNLLIAPWLPLRSSRKMVAVATDGVIFGR